VNTQHKILLADATDERILSRCNHLQRAGIAEVELVGDADTIFSAAESFGISHSKGWYIWSQKTFVDN